jgi:hypothetical protein
LNRRMNEVHPAIKSLIFLNVVIESCFPPDHSFDSNRGFFPLYNFRDLIGCIEKELPLKMVVMRFELS